MYQDQDRFVNREHLIETQYHNQTDYGQNNNYLHQFINNNNKNSNKSNNKNSKNERQIKSNKIHHLNSDNKNIKKKNEQQSLNKENNLKDNRK